MKHALITFTLVFVTLFSVAQTDYNRGFDNGYKEGFCYNDFSCIPPIPPIPPIPNIGESYDDYQDGYNRGFKRGLEDKQKDKSKKEGYTSGSKRIERNSSIDFVPEYDLSLIANALAKRQAAYDNNEAYIDNLIQWTYKLKSETNDKQFISIMNMRYTTLRSFDGKDLSLLGREIRLVELQIREDIEDYNNRIKTEYDPVIYWEKAQDFFDKQEYVLAIQQLNLVINLSPNHAESYLIRGYSYNAIGNKFAAIEDYNMYIQLRPTEPKGYRYRGWTKFYQKDYMGAMADFNKQIQLSPDSYEGYYNRGSVKSELNDHSGAIKDYQKSVDLNPNFSMAYNNMAWSKYILKRYKEALIDVNKAIELDNTNYVAFDSRADIKFSLKDYEGCIDDCNRTLSLNPNTANAFFLKGRAKYRQGNKKIACDYWSQAGELGKAEAYEYISTYCN